MVGLIRCPTAFQGQKKWGATSPAPATVEESTITAVESGVHVEQEG